MFQDAYRGRRVLVTGHTGFKGSWLALWLSELGALVAGVSLDPPTEPSHWALLQLGTLDHRHDVLDRTGLEAIIAAFRPEVVFHLAAQSLVRRSYRDPVETWSANVMGTAHVLSACLKCASTKAVVVVTTDKVYANREDGRAFREHDPLGGHDPYSASKAACELLVESYRKAFFAKSGCLVASARAGNVVGGGDWSEDRLIPDAVRALTARRSLVVRSPDARRPWQHVLECIGGYLLLGQALLAGRRECASAWNFGPEAGDHCKVRDVLGLLRQRWPNLQWAVSGDPQPHEAGVLNLDHAKASRELDWRPVWRVEEALQVTADWYSRFLEQRSIDSARQLARYVGDATSRGAVWAAP